MKKIVVTALACVMLGALSPAVAHAAPSTPAPADSLVASQGFGRDVRVALHAETGKARFIGSTNGKPVETAQSLGLRASSRSTSATALRFLQDHGSLFGLRDARQDLRLKGVEPTTGERSVARFQQTYHGVPVLAGELAVSTTASGDVLSAAGELLPSASVETTPRIGAAAAARAARGVLAKATAKERAALAVTAPSLWIDDARLLGGTEVTKPTLVWRTEVTTPVREDVRELVLVDARTGEIVLHFNQVAHAKNRRVCDARNSQSRLPCAAPYARVEGGPATGIADIDLAYEYGGGVYDYFKSRFGRDSIDNAGMPIIQTVRYCDGACPFENAFWNGSQMVYGPNYASADDVVGHELTHGVTDKTSNLLYWFQSGAINESISDIMGEFYDQINGRGNDSAAVRWKMGEDLPIGAIRDMKTPGLYSQPDRMTSTLYDRGSDSYGSVSDSGGVHTNSGPSNKAAYLLSDGGTFNGKTIAKLGIEKVARIYDEANTNILTSGSDYQDLHEALYQACATLVGSAGITGGDCTQVRNATLATEMHLQPGGGGFPAVPEAPVCATGQVPADLFYDNMENPASGNYVGRTPVGANKWAYDRDAYSPSGAYALGSQSQDPRTDAAIELKTGVVVPKGTTYLRFSQANHWEAGLDSSWNWVNADGGVVEYSANGGAWTDAAPLFTHNGYYGTISADYDNPLKGRAAFTGTTGGYFSSRLNLSSLAGKTVKFRFRAGQDSGNFDDDFWGWEIDDVRVYTCAAGTRPGPAAANLLRNPGLEWDDNDDGFADFWTQSTGALRMPTAKHSGRYALRHRALGNSAYSVTQLAGGIVAGARYNLSAYVAIPATTKPVSFTVYLQFRNSSGKALSMTAVKTFTAHTSGAWHRPALTVKAPAGATSARVFLTQRGLASTVYSDDVILKRV